MPGDRSSSSGTHLELYDLAPRDAAEESQIAEVRRALDAGQLVHRRTLPVFTTQFAGSLPAWAAGLRTESAIGPIRDRVGREVWFDLFQPVKQVRFVRKAGGAPFLTLPVEQFVIANRAAQKDFDLGPGSFWLATRLLDATAPDDAYTGLRIQGGKLHFDKPVDLGGKDEVLVPADVKCNAKLTLDPPDKPAGSGPGQDVRDALFQPPKSVTFHISGAHATTVVDGPAKLTLYGQSVDLAPFLNVPAPTKYLAQFNRVNVPLMVKQKTFTVQQVQSTAVHPEGSALIGVGSWALPAARIAPENLGQASGVGALMLHLHDGLTITWSGQSDPVALGAPFIFLDESRLAISSDSAQGYAVAQHPAFPESFARSRVALKWDGEFGISYFAQAIGTEAIFTSAAISASFAKPVDIRGERIAFHAPNALVIFVVTKDGGLLWLQGNIPLPPKNRGLGFGLTNAVLRATLPKTFLLIAAYDGVECTEGAVAIGYDLLSIIPTLPDPYATNHPLEPAKQDGPLLTTITRWKPGSVTVEFVMPPGAKLPSEAPFNVQTPPAVLGDALDFELNPRLILLDLSTNVSQFGVAVKAQNDPPQSVAVQGLDLAVDGRHLLLLTLPAVQWEPVKCDRVPDDVLYPERLTFNNSGVPSVIDVPTVNLVPVRPDAALDRIVGNFAQANPKQANARFTLPFGMIAKAVLRKSNPGAKVTEARPKSADGLEGGRQLRIDAVGGALPGFTAQLPNALPGPRSILGESVTTIFNESLGHGGADPLVPVTRIDLSGFGETLFSEWNHPDQKKETVVSKAEFTVLIGRTAHEVVQVRSILLPYCVPVVRTITMDRRSHGMVMRHDSGWVAAGVGKYEFANSDIVTHPGVVTKMTNVSHIRETGERIMEDGIEFAAVEYNGDVELHSGQGKKVPVTKHLGYIKLGTDLLTPEIYAALLARVGRLCGPLDATIQIGGGKQAMRLHRIGVGVTQTDDGPEFVMTAWGALAFPGGGEWSILYADDPKGAPQAVPKDEGLPVIRAGNGAYRFADPVDLAHESAPSRDYGILHSTGTQRAFFRRPRIEPAQLSRIVSSQKPVIADPYILATAHGLFPLQSDAIPFPTADYALVVGDGGSYKLDLQPSTTFDAGIGRRTIRAAGSVRSDIDYSKSKVTYEIDTDEEVPWKFGLTNAARIMSNAAMGDMITLTVNMNAQAGRELSFDEPSMELGGALGIVKDVLTILSGFGIAGTFITEMTNAPSFNGALNYPFCDKEGDDLQIPPKPAKAIFKFAGTGVSLGFTIHPFADTGTFDLGGNLMILVRLPSLYVVAIVGFTINLSTETGTTYKLLCGFGVAKELSLTKKLTLTGLLGITWFAVWGDSILGWGAGFLVSLSLSLSPFLSIEFTLEGRFAQITVGLGTEDETLFNVSKITWAIEVTVVLVISISIEGEGILIRNIRGPLPDSAVPAIV